MGRWDYETLRCPLTDLCFQAEGSDWSEIALKLFVLRRLGVENYKP
jgi:hypothetical protein